MRGFVLFSLIFLISLNSSRSDAQVQDGVKKLRALSVDFDDTFMHTSSKIYIYNKMTDNELGVSTLDFAHVREGLGKPGKFEQFELRFPDDSKSFREFSDAPERNIVLEAIQTTISQADPNQWQGPAWDIITESLNDPEQAKWFSIITARGHSARELHQAVDHLSNQGYFRYTPREEFIFPVGSPEQRALGFPTEKLKVLAMERVLDKLQKEVVRRQARGEKIRGEFIFIDDDYKNYEKADQGLKELSHRWPDVDLYVSFVGKTKADTAPFSTRVKGLRPEELSCKQIVYL
ncbi:MAG: hypothetical protein RJB66_677 [Pseudomonadota bacterium]